MRLIKTAGVFSLLLIQLSWAKFDPCRFNFGCKAGTGNFAEVDIIAQYTWQGTGLEGDIAQMLGDCKNSNKTPALYMYVIAKSSGLGDCNTGGGLCSAGANYIRNNKDKIRNIYKSYASSIKNTFGTTEPIILFMEPDYFQYAQPGSQGGNPLSFSEAGEFIEECVDIIKAELPNAYVSLDLSPWIADQGVANQWLNALPLAKVDFMNTSGGISQAGSNMIKSENKLSWSAVHDITGKCIFADAGYGVGGGGTGHDAAWDDVNNINNRIANGVMGIIQFSPKGDWGNTIKSISGQLNTPICSCGRKFSLNVTAGKGGKVTVDPEAQSYDSGSTVTLTATPDNGYTFKSWGGDGSGTDATLEITVNSDMKITASFVDPDAKPTYTLTITTKGSGLVTVDPEKVDYDSGTTVTLEVFSVNGGVFNGWGGALSGSGTFVSLVMNGDKTVSATFSGEDVKPAENLVKNGGFTDGTTGWNLGNYDNGKANGTVENDAYKLAIESTGGESWNIQLTQCGIALTKGERYELAFIASAPSATKVIVNIGMAASPYTSFSEEREIELTSQAIKHTIAFTMKEESTTDARLEFNVGLASGNLTIDDISLAPEQTIDVQAPYKIGSEKAACSDNGKVDIFWYDFHGRLLHQVSGNYSTLIRGRTLRYPGSHIAVVRIGDRRIIKRVVTLNR